MTNRPLLSDVAVLPETTAPECIQAQHDATVLVVLRWAARARCGLPTVEEVCGILGVGPTLERLLGRDPEPPPEVLTELERAWRWLHTHLSDQGGWAIPSEVIEAAFRAGHREGVIRRAKRQHGVITCNYGSHWTWELPPEGQPVIPATERDERCGTCAGYQLHLRQATTPCEPCRDANSTYVREYRRAKKANAG